MHLTIWGQWSEATLYRIRRIHGSEKLQLTSDSHSRRWGENRLSNLWRFLGNFRVIVGRDPRLAY